MFSHSVTRILVDQTLQIGNRQQTTNRGISAIDEMESWKKGVQYVLTIDCISLYVSLKTLISEPLALSVTENLICCIHTLRFFIFLETVNRQMIK